MREVVYFRMRPNRRNIVLVIVLMSVSLLGLVAVQVALLNRAYTLKEQTFDQNVRTALIAASFVIQAGETITSAVQVVGAGGKWDSREVRAETLLTAHDSLPRTGSVRTNMVFAGPRAMRLQLTTVPPIDSALAAERGSASPHVHPLAPGKTAYSYRVTSDTINVVSSGGVSVRTADSARLVFITQVMDNLRRSEQLPLEQRLARTTLDTVVRNALRTAGIPLAASYGILAARGSAGTEDTVCMATPQGSEAGLRSSEFSVPLAPWSPPRLRERLVFDFPDRKLYLLGQLWGELLASVVFLALLVGTFAYTFRTIVLQQRLAGQMTDFVNTMTHEFKTPLATIALTTEAISRPDVVPRKAKVLQYNAIIAEEAERMKKQVDRILHMAQMEEGDLDLSIVAVNVHELIGSVVSTFAVQVESRGGTIALDLQAKQVVVRGDAVHLANILRSLLDNANKYSPGVPAIRVTTRNREGMVEIDVADQGMGIAPEHQRRVFEKYFRVPKGNLHDVKGFGLGLSYVKLLVEAHHGRATLSSAPGRGTTVTIALPVSSHD